MFIIYGRRTLRIRKYTANTHFCNNCGSPLLNVKVYKQYFHVFFVPFFPSGDKTVKIHCSSCGEPLRNEAIQYEFGKKVKSPFYLYSGPLLIAALVIWLVIANIQTQKEKAKFVENPQLGDVYLIRDHETRDRSYYFLRIARINGDSVITYHSNLVYNGFVSRLSSEDFFVKEEEMVFTKQALKKMLDNGTINSVERGNDDSEGFNRIK